MMNTADMLKAFQKYRGDAIVIPGRGSPHWHKISTQPSRDLPMGDPAMGGHGSFGFGIAMAQPDKKVVLFDSDGDVLMNLGALATIAEVAPKNFYHFILDNECYATTGGQPVPNAKNVQYDVIAKGSGYPHTFAFDSLEEFAVNIEAILALEGPVFVTMKVTPEVENLPIEQRARWQTRTRDQILGEFRTEMGLPV